MAPKDWTDKEPQPEAEDTLPVTDEYPRRSEGEIEFANLEAANRKISELRLLLVGLEAEKGGMQAMLAERDSTIATIQKALDSWLKLVPIHLPHDGSGIQTAYCSPTGAEKLLMIFDLYQKAPVPAPSLEPDPADGSLMEQVEKAHALIDELSSFDVRGMAVLPLTVGRDKHFLYGVAGAVHAVRERLNRGEVAEGALLAMKQATEMLWTDSRDVSLQVDKQGDGSVKLAVSGSRRAMRAALSVSDPNRTIRG